MPIARRTATLLIMLATAIIAAPASAASVATTPGTRATATTAGAAGSGTTCNRLRGTDLAPDRRVKLVRRPNNDSGTDLVGCVLPRGRVRKLAETADQGTTTYDYTVTQIAGSIVLLASSYSSQYASDQSVSVFDLGTGRRYRIAYSCDRLGPEPCGGQNTTAAVALVNARGQAAAAIIGQGTEVTTIAAFSSRGERQDLDFGPSTDLPAASLALTDNTVSWTHSGEPRSATTSG
jgi:hypothetical protein